MHKLDGRLGYCEKEMYKCIRSAPFAARLTDGSSKLLMKAVCVRAAPNCGDSSVMAVTWPLLCLGEAHGKKWTPGRTPEHAALIWRMIKPMTPSVCTGKEVLLKPFFFLMGVFGVTCRFHTFFAFPVGINPHPCIFLFIKY